jgi:hypothetical protein
MTTPLVGSDPTGHPAEELESSHVALHPTIARSADNAPSNPGLTAKRGDPETNGRSTMDQQSKCIRSAL